MENASSKKIVVLLSSLLIMVAIVPALQGVVRASSPSAYSFNLIGPNRALATNTIPGTPIEAGAVLRLTGSGLFDVSSATASGGGSFTHYNPDGSVFARGTWVVTGFQSFTPYGGPSSGKQGGLLRVTITLFGPEATFAGLTLQVSCEINAPSGSPGEGTTILGLFPVPVGGRTLFHIGS
jgi:hypothetical protein